MSVRDFPIVAMFCLSLISISVGSYQLGRVAGMEQIKLLENKIETPAYAAPVNVDKQCVAWMFQSNMKDVKKHICGGKK